MKVVEVQFVDAIKGGHSWVHAKNDDIRYGSQGIQIRSGDHWVVVPWTNIKWAVVHDGEEQREVVGRGEGAGEVGGGGRVRGAGGRFVAKGGPDPKAALGNP